MSVINEEELQEIVEVVWMTALELPVRLGSEDELVISDYITADISIAGAWQGSVSLRASKQFLSHAASLMFNCHPDETTDLDRRDTLTELTNMLGGTVKCLLPETCDLSLPTILIDDSAASSDHNWINFSCEGKPLSVAVTQSVHCGKKVA